MYCRAMQATDDNTIRRVRLACWITTATANTQECVIRVAFSRQLWLRERASVLRYSTLRVFLFQGSYITNLRL
jgi:hypothetical protein